MPHKEDTHAESQGSGDNNLAEGTKSGPLAIREFREFLVSSQRTIDEWQRKMDDRIRGVVEGISPFRGLHTDVQSLAERIAELEARLSLMVAEDDHQAPE